MAGRKTKYSPERVETICQAIAAYGGDEAGWKAGRISKQTFYVWLKDFPDFCDLIECAREQFRENLDENLKITTLSRLQDILQNGQIIRWTKTIKRGKTTRNGASEQNCWTEEYEETIEESEENRGVPQWAIERVLGKPIQSLEEAIKLIEAHGLKPVVADADLFKQWLFAQTQASSEDSEGGSRTGISEETANEIRARILGVPENAARSSSLSSEMDQ